MFQKIDYVYAVYKEKSFTKAAEKLFIAQPSLSAAIKKIEREVGAPIFNRGSEVTLTEIGKEYIAAVERIMSVQNEFVNRVNDIYNLEVGHIAVGGTNYLACYVLPQIINRFSALYPKVEVTLVEANSRALGEMIRNEELDIVVDSFQETLNEYTSYPLAKERLLLCVPAEREINEHLSEFAISSDRIYEGDKNALAKSPVPIEVFKDENFILLKSGNVMYHCAVDVFENAGIMPRVSFSVDQLNISYFLAESGMGLCFATDTLFRFGKFRNKVKLYNVGEEHSSRTLYIAHKKSKYCTSAMKKFIAIAKEVIAPT